MSRHIDKAELISKIRELAGLTSDEKSALLELLNEKKTYGLVWENHIEAVEEQLREQLPVLREVPERRILYAAAQSDLPAAQSDLQSDCEEYKDLQSDKRITNAGIHGERIANPLERVPNHIIIDVNFCHIREH